MSKSALFRCLKSLFFLLLVGGGVVYAQPTIEWQKTFGGNSFDESRNIKQTSDGGYIISGSTGSTNGDIFGNHGGFDIWVLKLTNNGSVQWKRTLGGTENDDAITINQTFDGGYFISGYSASNDFDVSGNHGGDFDGWVVKLSSNGVIEWQKALGGSGWDDIWSSQQTADHGYILTGRTESNDGDVTENHGQFDYWVVKLDESGNIEWQKTYGGSKDEYAKSIIQTQDGGYIVAGQSASNDGDVTELNGNVDFWIVKLSGTGSLEWQKSFGGDAADIPSAVIQAVDGGFIVTGYTGSDSGDVTGHHGSFDYWVIKLSSNGELEWQKTLGGSEADWGRAIVPQIDGGFVVLGGTQSSNGDVLGNNSGAEFWIVKLSATGQLIWQQTYGGTMAEAGFAIDNTTDNGFILAGYAWSTNGDLTGSQNKGKNDFWIVKLSPEPTSPTQEPAPIAPLTIYPNPATHTISLRSNTETGTMTVRISDLLGREMLRKEMVNGGQVDVGALASGLYIVHAVAEDGKVFRGNLIME